MLISTHLRKVLVYDRLKYISSLSTKITNASFKILEEFQFVSDREVYDRQVTRSDNFIRSNHLFSHDQGCG